VSLRSYASSFKNASVSNTEIDALDKRSRVVIIALHRTKEVAWEVA